MKELKNKQIIVRMLMIMCRLMYVIGFVTLILSFVPDSEYKFINPIIFIILEHIVTDKLCTCKRCGYKMSRKDFLAKKDLICPNENNHNIY